MILIKKLINKIFPNNTNDETIRFLEEISNAFLERIKSYGFESVEEYNLSNEIYFATRSEHKYPLGSDI